jgi:hypothetical protein
MSHAHNPSRFQRSFFIVSSAFMSAFVAAFLLSIAGSWLSRPVPIDGLWLLFFAGNLVGQKLKNYLWGNLFVATLVMVAWAVFTPQSFAHQGVLADVAGLYLGSLANAKAMLLLRDLANRG